MSGLNVPAHVEFKNFMKNLRLRCRHAWLLSGLVAAGGLLFAASLRAQSQTPDANYRVDTWQMEEGLPENIVNAIAQTPDGYLWCGTTRGLARFDGLHFKVFDATTSPALGNGNIRQLLVDHRGALWSALPGGILVRLEAGQFTQFVPPTRQSAGRTFIRMAEDATGALWLTAEDGVLFRFANGIFAVASAKWDPNHTNYFQIHADDQGRPWVGCRNGLARIENGELAPVLQGRPSQYLILCSSHSGAWWVRSGGRVRLWRDGNFVADAGEVLWGDYEADSCIEDRQGDLWVASLGGGLFRYATNRPVLHLTANKGLGSDLVRAVFEDAEGDVWCGLRAGGLSRLRTALFQTYGRQEGLASDQITAICEGADGDLWVGSDGQGLDRLQHGVITHFGRAQGLAGRFVRALAFDRRGDLWAGTWPGGLFKFETNHFVAVKNLSGAKFALASLFEDSQSNLWLGQRAFNQLIRLTNGVPAAPVDLTNSAPSLDIISMTEDRSGNLWVGTEASGLFRWHDGRCRRFTRADGLPNTSIRSLFADNDGALWIGTMNGGLCRLKHDHVVTCTMKDGLVDNVINCIADDKLGNLWFSSFRGIFRASKADLNAFADGTRPEIQCVAYGKSDGLPTIECQGGFQPAGCRTKDGRLWFPTIKGLVSVDPSHLNTRSIQPPVFIEEFVVDNKVFASGTNLAAGHRLAIPPGRHGFEFRYTGLNFAAPERLRFRTKLEGLDLNWVDAGDRRTADYPPLPPGDYEFRVIACNQAGLWNEIGAALTFRQLPYFWQTWWFISALMLSAGGLLAGTVLFASRRRWHRRFERLQMQLSVERERARIAQDIHDGVGANLTEIAWLAEVAEKDAVNPNEVRRQARKISGTARATVELFDEIVWAVLPKNDTLASLVQYLGRRVD